MRNIKALSSSFKKYRSLSAFDRHSQIRDRWSPSLRLFPTKYIQSSLTLEKSQEMDKADAGRKRSLSTAGRCRRQTLKHFRASFSPEMEDVTTPLFNMQELCIHIRQQYFILDFRHFPSTMLFPHQHIPLIRRVRHSINNCCREARGQLYQLNHPCGAVRFESCRT